MKTIRTSELADLLGVHPQTIRSYVKNEKIPYHRTPSGQLMFTPADVKEIIGENPEVSNKTWAYYVRSSSGRKSSFSNQIAELTSNYPDPVKVYRDSASGLNENRKGLKKALLDAEQGMFTHLAVTTPDRLTRFGITFLEQLFKKNSVTITYLHSEENSSPHDELLQDFMSLIASFSGRFYKMRSKENQLKLLKTVEKEVSKSE